jgi:RNA polymerase sigma factor (sigma-70 family)
MSRISLDAVPGNLRRLLAAGALADATDDDLLLRFQRNREPAVFEAIVRRHGPAVLSACRKVLDDQADVDDAFQATMVVLLRRPEAIRDPRRLGSWLYGVAHRIALRARALSARRDRLRRGTAPSPSAEDKLMELSWREACAILHEELDRLPDSYRLPLLLCYLGGLTRDEAAATLDCSTAVLRGRLERGRDKLKSRLVRRGVALSAGLLAALRSSPAAAGPSPALIQLTLRSAEGLTSPAVGALVRGALPMVLTSKTSMALGIALVGLLGVALALRQPTIGAGEKSASPRKEQATTPAKPADATKGPGQSVSGVVLGSDGKPVAAADLVLIHENQPPLKLGATGKDGRFSVLVPKDRQGKDNRLVARLAGAGLDFVSLSGEAKSVELKLVKDNPIRGRVVSTEGKPVPGVRVEVTHVGVYPNDSLDSFLVSWKKRHFMSGLPGGVKHLWEGEHVLYHTKTDQKGRFTIEGIGAERLVFLRLRGAGKTEDEIRVVNRPRFDPKPYNDASRNNIPKMFEDFGPPWLLQGPDVSVVAESEKPIRGAVTAADTGKGLPGVDVWLSRNGKALLAIPLKTTTDANGRFEIRGARKAREYMLEVKSDPKTAYMACQLHLADTHGYEPLSANIRVKKGVLVTGRVIDRATGKGVPGNVMVAVLRDNPHAKDYPGFDSSAWFPMRPTTDDGAFRVVAIPGPVLLMAGPDGRKSPTGWEVMHHYNPPAPDPKYPEYFPKDPLARAYFAYGGGQSIIQGNACKVLKIEPGAREVKQDIYLEPAAAFQLKVQDAEGRPLPGALVAGVSPEDWHHPTTCKTDVCTVYGLKAGKSRLLVFFEAKKQLAAVTLEGGGKEAVVKLGKPGAVKGRLLGEDGKPLAGVAVNVHYRARVAAEVHGVVYRAKQVVTDGDGRFSVEPVLPGLKFELAYGQGRRTFRLVNKRADPNVEVKPGAQRDLGSLTVKRAPEGD